MLLAPSPGLGSYVQPGKRKMETLIPEAVRSGEDLEEVRKRAKLEEESLDGDGDEKM